jgi:3-methyladenine DNA glycosylase Mpg
MKYMDYQEFFSRKVDEVAPELLGRFLIRKTKNGVLTARIIGTGAYEGGNETPSRQGMKYAPGRLFLMPFRGSRLFNIATEKEGVPSCVEVRTLRFMDGIVDGAGKVTRFYELSPEMDNLLFGTELQIEGERADPNKILRQEGNAGNCLGYFYLND